MKRITALALALLMLLSALTASAQPITADEMAAHSEALCIYIGEGNHLFAEGESVPLVAEPVSKLDYVSETMLIYEIVEETFDDHDRESTLLIFNLVEEEMTETPILATDVVGAVWSEADGILYYATHGEPTALRGFDPQLYDDSVRGTADGEITRLRRSVDGLLAATATGEKLFIPVLKRFEAPIFDATDMTIDVSDIGRFETLHAPDGALFLRVRGSAAPIQIASDVLCARTMDDSVLFLSSNGGNPTLSHYDIATLETKVIYSFQEPLRAELAYDADGCAFVLGQSGVLYRVRTGDGTCEPIAVINLSTVLAPVLIVFEDLVLVYDASGDANTFVAKVETEKAELDPADIDPVPAPPETDDEDDEPVPTPSAPDPTAKPAPDPTKKPVPTATPAPEFETLSVGSRGDAVARLQRKLISLEYLSGKADGIYGKSTQTAVTYLQGDMGYTETGSAGPKFQHAVFYGKPPVYQRYVALRKGDEGIRVKELQSRLRTLCYTVANAGGHYQDQTVAAVRRFQKQMGFKQADSITARELKELFSKSAPRCNQYFLLEKGDSGPAAERLNTRLKKLRYLSGTPSSTFNAKSIDAIKLFQLSNGVRPTGVCDNGIQNMLYSSNAKPYAPDPTPTPKPKPTATPKPSTQVISKKQLRAITEYLSKVAGKKISDVKAVNHLQQFLIDIGLMPTRHKSGIYDQNTLDAVRDYQTTYMHLLGAGGIADKKVLKSMFPH